MALALPDLADMEFLVTLGANPVMSHGSLVSIPRMKNQMNELVRRGGRILAIDPRRTETAAKFEWLPITPDTDAWLLLSLLQVMFGEGLVDESALQKAASGVETLRELTSPFNPEHTAQFTGIEAEEVRALAAELVAKRSMIYGRTGTCLGSRSTLVNYLIDAVNLAAGNLDVRGGGVFGAIPFPLMDRILRRIGGLSYKRRRSRIGNLPVFLGHQPAAEMAAEITTPGPGQLRAMFVCSGNPALSTPNGPELEKALDQLDLLVSLDLYVNETGAHADYVLPGAAMYEHPDIPATALFGTYTQPFVQATEAVVPPPGEARQEFEVLTDIARRVLLGKTAMLPLKLATGLGTRLGLRMNGRAVLDAILKFGFGNRPGQLSFAKLLRRHPHGLILADRVPFGRLPKLIGYKDRKVCLDHELIRGEITRLAEYSSDPAYPLRLIGMRESRSENSWMHNVMTDKRMLQTARLHPEDAAAIGLSDGEKVRVSSKAGSIELPVTITADIKPGVVAIPHGWGHKGGGSWQRANANPGVNINELASSDPGDIEPLAGMSHLSGIAIRLEPVSEQRSVA